MEKYEVGNRLQFGKDFCTIKYIGQIDAWQNELAFGVEWDNVDRGKHSGSINGCPYFTTEKRNAGSFLKFSKVKKSSRRCFFEALEEIYTTPSDVNIDLFMGSKKIESFGFEALNERNMHIESRSILSLENMSIFSSAICGERKNYLLHSYKNLTSLNLSNNLFHDFADIITLLDVMPALTKLVLSGNRFQKVFQPPNINGTYHNVKHLILANCNLNVLDAEIITKLFPSLEILDLGGNDLSELASMPINLSRSLSSLSLRDTSLTELPIALENTLIKNLDISHNQIKTIFNPSINFQVYSSLSSLDISYNLISEWNVIDDINRFFNSLKSLRINENPLILHSLEKYDSNNELFLTVLARFDDLDVLDGSILTSYIKDEAEMYFISQIMKNNLHFTNHSSKWSYYNDKYNLEEKLQTTKFKDLNFSILADLEILNINIFYQVQDKPFVVSVLSNSTIRFLKGIIGERIGISVLNMKLFYKPTGDLGSKVEITREFSLIRDLGLSNYSDIYVMDF